MQLRPAQSSCSMNSRRIPPGASTKAIRRRPKGPSTTSGPHTTRWPASSASRSSVNSGMEEALVGQVHAVLVDGAGEQRDLDRAQLDIGALGAAPARAVADLGPGRPVELA